MQQAIHPAVTQHKDGANPSSGESQARMYPGTCGSQAQNNEACPPLKTALQYGMAQLCTNAPMHHKSPWRNHISSTSPDSHNGICRCGPPEDCPQLYAAAKPQKYGKFARARTFAVYAYKLFGNFKTAHITHRTPRSFRATRALSR